MAGRRARTVRSADVAIAVADFIMGNLAASLVTKVAATMTGVEVRIGGEHKRPIDARIARLDEPRAALAEGLGAIDERRGDAKRAMAEHADVMAALESALSNRKDAEQKLEAISGIIAQDVTAFRKIADLTDVRTERLIGFASGGCASVLASALWSWGPLVYPWIGSLFARAGLGNCPIIFLDSVKPRHVTQPCFANLSRSTNEHEG
jgi:hypothetical protein